MEACIHPRCDDRATRLVTPWYGLCTEHSRPGAVITYVAGYGGAHIRHRKVLDLSHCAACGTTEDVEAALKWSVPIGHLLADPSGSPMYSLDPNDYVAACPLHNNRMKNPAAFITELMTT